MKPVRKIGLSTDTKAECLALILTVYDSDLDMKKLTVFALHSSLSIRMPLEAIRYTASNTTKQIYRKRHNMIRCIDLLVLRFQL